MLRIFTRHFLLSAFVLTFAVSQSHAQVADLVLGGSPRTDGGKVVGISLNSHGQTLTSLGFYDHNDDGIATSYQLGLWDSTQTLVRTATVTPSSPLTDGFRYASIAPITLGTFSLPETFTIGVVLPDNPADIWLDSAIMILTAGFSGAGTGQYSGPSGTLIYPSTVDTGNNYYVVNANGPAPPLVPEPATAVVVTGFALAFAASIRRSRD
jgi:hypothetical protein